MPTNDGAPTIGESLEEAAQQHLGKESKLEMALQAVLVDDVRKLAAHLRNGIRKLEAKRLWGGEQVAEEDVGEMILADNISITNQQTPPGPKPPSLLRKVLPLILGGVLGSGALGGGLLLLDRFLSKPAPPRSVTIEKKETRGFLIDLIP